MPYFKLGFVALAITIMSLPSVAEAQGFTQRGTRNGAIAGAIIGGIVGDQNNEALAGAAIGGLVGGVTGRAIGRSQDAQYWNGYYQGARYNSYHQPTYFNRGYGGVYQTQFIPVAPAPVFRGGYYGGTRFYGAGYGGYYRGGCGTW